MNGKNVPYLQDADLLSFALVVVCPIIVSLFKQYHTDMLAYVFDIPGSETLLSQTVSTSPSRPKTSSGRNFPSSSSDRLSGYEFWEPTQQFVDKVQTIILPGEFKALDDMMEDLRIILPQIEAYTGHNYNVSVAETPYHRRAKIRDHVPDGIVLRRISHLPTQKFRSNIRATANHESVKARKKQEIVSVLGKLTEHNGKENLRKYASITFSIMQEVISFVRHKSNSEYAYCMPNKHEVKVSIQMLKFLRQMYEFVRECADAKHPKIVE